VPIDSSFSVLDLERKNGLNRAVKKMSKDLVAEPQESNRSDALSEKKLVGELRREWKRMWMERFDDKSKAEGISTSDYQSLFIERGTILHATRDFKPLNFRDILKQNQVSQPDRFIQPDSSVGGWNKFIKTNIRKRNGIEPMTSLKTTPGNKEQKKKTGWLHL